MDIYKTQKLEITKATPDFLRRKRNRTFLTFFFVVLAIFSFIMTASFITEDRPGLSWMFIVVAFILILVAIFVYGNMRSEEIINILGQNNILIETVVEAKENFFVGYDSKYLYLMDGKKDKIYTLEFSVSRHFNSHLDYSLVFLDKERKLLLLIEKIDGVQSYLIEGKDIVGVELESDTSHFLEGEIVAREKQDFGDSLLRAGVGGALFGNMGALVGAATGKRTTTYHQKEGTVYVDKNSRLYVYVSNFKIPIISINFSKQKELAEEWELDLWDIIE